MSVESIQCPVDPLSARYHPCLRGGGPPPPVLVHFQRQFTTCCHHFRRPSSPLYIYLRFSTIFIVFEPKCSNLLPPRATQNQKKRQKVMFDIKYKNFLAPQATPKENSNILTKISTQINVLRGEGTPFD